MLRLSNLVERGPHRPWWIPLAPQLTELWATLLKVTSYRQGTLAKSSSCQLLWWYAAPMFTELPNNSAHILQIIPLVNLFHIKWCFPACFLSFCGYQHNRITILYFVLIWWNTKQTVFELSKCISNFSLKHFGQRLLLFHCSLLINQPSSW